jgi:ElaB/YqjD/DUF883 family membrane-anchored ribosome-binding protein
MARAEIPVAEALSQAHKALQDDLRKLEQAARMTSEKGWEGLCARLSLTHALVIDHFHLEEQGGYMDAVRKRQPRLERVVQELEEEHRQLAQSLEALLEETNKATGASDTLREKVLAWVQRIREHEARENDLFQDAFNVDIGAED